MLFASTARPGALTRLVSLPVWLVSCLGRKSTEGCAMLRLYDSLLSGNSWKVRILLSQLHLTYERVTLDLARGDTHLPDFCKISRFSRIPALMIDDGRESDCRLEGLPPPRPSCADASKNINCLATSRRRPTLSLLSTPCASPSWPRNLVKVSKCGS